MCVTQYLPKFILINKNVKKFEQWATPYNALQDLKMYYMYTFVLLTQETAL